jgi:hypothetical protein
MSLVQNGIFALARKGEHFLLNFPLLRAEVFGDDPRLPTDPARESIDIAATRSLAGKGAFKVIG